MNFFHSTLVGIQARLAALEADSEAAKLRADLAVANQRIANLEDQLTGLAQTVQQHDVVVQAFPQTTDRLERALQVLDPDVRRVVEAVKEYVA